eukprot:TRINITY_DN6389_c0_g1_i1.p1 TRINITY_DN6389_c0_g1~~TRINITY_DN6389_c0_g1_i1.p1  ORF type:complete len:238 (-),score=19.29 TRINITY_DN6389_c0_g1_i1:243-956(-)
MGLIGLAVGDAIICFLWMFFSSFLAPATFVTSSYLGLEEPLTTGVTLGLLTVLVFVFSLVGDALGGITWNPTALSANYALGIGTDSLLALALRFPAQAAGAVGGVLAIAELMPAEYKHFLVGPSLKVDLHQGAVAEGVLTMLITYLVLLILIRGPRNTFYKSFLISCVTILFVVAGSTYTGPSMNPINAYGWAYLNNTHNNWDHFYVYWLAPFVGSIISALLFRLTALPPPQKQKAA